MRSVPELPRAIEAIGKYAAASGQGLEAEECQGLFRLAINVTTIALRVERMWEDAFVASKGGAQ